jgi:hypothetical protein
MPIRASGRTRLPSRTSGPSGESYHAPGEETSPSSYAVWGRVQLAFALSAISSSTSSVDDGLSGAVPYLVSTRGLCLRNVFAVSYIDEACLACTISGVHGSVSSQCLCGVVYRRGQSGLHHMVYTVLCLRNVFAVVVVDTDSTQRYWLPRTRMVRPWCISRWSQSH